MIWSQVPDKMSYQAVVRDADNNLISNQPIGLKLSIIEGTTSGSAVFEETHTVNSNMNGLVSIIINEGSTISGDFATINWSSNSYFIKAEIDPNGGSNYTITGIQQVLSVPYALHAQTADNFTFQDAEFGEMLFYDGTDWVAVLTGVNGQALTYCNGVPTWGLCLESSIGNNPTSSTITVNGSISTNLQTNRLEIFEIGVCYSTSPNPTITDLKKIVNTTALTWGVVLGPLDSGTQYYAKAYVIYESGDVTYGNEVSSTTTTNALDIGNYYPEEGGVIFYILQPGDDGYDPDVTHGLIVSLNRPVENLSSWGCDGTLIGNTDGVIGSGNANTEAIANNCDEPFFAAKVCRDFTSMGFDDWYLGSNQEMLQLAINRTTVNVALSQDIDNTAIAEERHWSSTEVDADDASSIYMINPSTQVSVKTASFIFRPIRSF